MVKNRTVMGVHAPAPRPTLWAALLFATGMSSAFLVVLSGFAAATRYAPLF